MQAAEGVPPDVWQQLKEYCDNYRPDSDSDPDSGADSDPDSDADSDPDSDKC